MEHPHLVLKPPHTEWYLVYENVGGTGYWDGRPLTPGCLIHFPRWITQLWWVQ